MATKRKTPWWNLPAQKSRWPVECQPNRARVVFDYPPPEGTLVIVSVTYPVPQGKHMRDRECFMAGHTFDHGKGQGL